MRIDTDGDDNVSDTEAASYLDDVEAGLIAAIELRLDGELADLSMVSRDIGFPEGQGGLSTLRLILDLKAELPSPAGSATYRADAYPDRIGWREVVVEAGDGIAVVNSSVPATDVSTSCERIQMTPSSVRSTCARRRSAFSRVLAHRLLARRRCQARHRPTICSSRSCAASNHSCRRCLPSA